ncbi:MAG: L-seryl-tRNA(Sec) selenium transferase [Candidatus Obscuribacterales bacterium]|nr:L-seryl-tRNA(Sec) selenium transferase [Candidatus Obscuribacterales bacterium]
MQTRLPQVDKLLRHETLLTCLAQYKRSIVLRVLRSTLEKLRTDKKAAEADEIAFQVKRQLENLQTPSLRKVLNGTGVVLNTNLGRSPISKIHLARLEEIASAYCNLELDLETGKRGKRSQKLDQLLCVLTGAQASIAVNNNAAAVVLAVNCFALGKEVVVSRGELIEIGGSFRLPDVIEAAGGKLREVGTTNKTRLSDFEKAIGPNTGLVMRCHRSNYEVKGFTEETPLSDLVKLCREKQVVLLEDLGSGVLMNLEEIGLEGEATVEESIELNCDLVSYSGDKLLGGVQAGIISGRKDLLLQLAKHPLYRALRLDKISISLLEQTLIAYLSNKPQELLPSLHLISQSREELQFRVESFIQKNEALLTNLKLKAVPGNSAIGGGSLPGKEKASAALHVEAGAKASSIAQSLRLCDPPVIAITRDDDILIDFRTIFDWEEPLLLKSLLQLDSMLGCSSS